MVTAFLDSGNTLWKRVICSIDEKQCFGALIDLIRQFWSTTEYLLREQPPCIRATIHNQEIRITHNVREGVEKQAKDVNVEAVEVNLPEGNFDNVEGVKDREAVPDVTEVERKALNERRMKRRHERQAPSGPQIKSESISGEADPSRPRPTRARSAPPAQSGSRQQPSEIHSREKMTSKEKVIALESEHDIPRKKAKHSQERLDEDILNMLNVATKREINFLKTQIMAFKDREDGREREITELKIERKALCE
ncbi:hypothetical protein L1987_57368 [Smallanthus sonchifolius]|uniref:Uncharacterized protein n=1 Tax=Smallanthus sonchifolius TaxID=185202 RepID=A0ACB9DCU6_9ASTR|nr:hypothetical protein L1987_57368 [Smallanthus sonchifolius]